MAKIDSKLISAYTKFGFKLFAEIAKRDADAKVFLSPVSVAITLGMMYSGAAGETREAMAKTLELEGMSKQEVNQANAELRQSLKNPDPEVELVIANSLWARKGIEFNPDFLEQNYQCFEAEIAMLDFSDPSAPEIINQWVATNTEGKIQEITGQLNVETVMLLINAIYFKGKWMTEFDESKTKDGIFHLPDGEQKQVPMMSQFGEYPYFRGQSFQAVNLPYGEDRIGMYIFLPDQGVPLFDFLENLNNENWGQWMSSFTQMEGVVTLPRFKLEYEKDLSGALKALGMEVAFDPNRANFEGIDSERDLFIQRVKHKTVVEVNEEGTEAAAATSVVSAITSMEAFTFVADRPFFFAIHDNQTAILLFLGILTEP